VKHNRDTAARARDRKTSFAETTTLRPTATSYSYYSYSNVVLASRPDPTRPGPVSIPLQLQPHHVPVRPADPGPSQDREPAIDTNTRRGEEQPRHAPRTGCRPLRCAAPAPRQPARDSERRGKQRDGEEAWPRGGCCHTGARS
jgi:hypothetical protein